MIWTTDPKVIAYAGDWHGRLSYALKAVFFAAQNGAEAIVHAGDFGFNFTPEFLDPLNERLDSYGIDLYFVDGNHENFHTLFTYPIVEGVRPLRERIIHLPRGTRWVWQGKMFLALGGAISVDKHRRTEGKTWWREERITWDEANKVIEGGPADIMITHDCPDGVEIPGLEDGHLYFPEHLLMESDGHRKLLRVIVDEVKPELLIHGHYHRRYTDTLVGDDYQTKVIGLDCDTESVLRNMIFMEEQNGDKTFGGT